MTSPMGRIYEAIVWEYHTRSVLGGLKVWYNDQLCKDMSVNPMRKYELLANLYEAYAPMDYTEI